MMRKYTPQIFLFCFSFLVLSCSKQARNGVGEYEDSKISIENKVQSDCKIYVQADSLQAVEVNVNMSRKVAHLDSVMLTIVEFINGPMSEPDPFHSHPHEQMTYIAEAECMVFIGDTKQLLKKYDIFAVPSNVRHSVQSLSAKLNLIDCFSPLREDFME